MDFLISSQATAVAAIFSLIIFLYSLLLISRNASNKKAAPEAGGAWPVIGHLHLLGGPEPSHRVLGNMADKYGPIFTIKMGVHRALVVSNWEIAKECFTTHDKVFANRPKTLAMEILGYNYSMFAFSPYGHYWRQVRKISTLELLSNHRLEKLKHVRESEVKASIKGLYEIWVKNKSISSNKVLVEMKRWFGDTTLNVILRIIVGKRCDSQEGEEWKEDLIKFFEMSGKFVVSDALPFLRWLDIRGDERSMKKIAKELDIVVQGWLQDHRKKRDSEESQGDEDFMDMMLSILDDAERFPGRDTDTINKATCLYGKGKDEIFSFGGTFGYSLARERVRTQFSGSGRPEDTVRCEFQKPTTLEPRPTTLARSLGSVLSFPLDQDGELEYFASDQGSLGSSADHMADLLTTDM